MAREISTGHSYPEKLLRLIPSEIVAAYLAINGIIPSGYSKWGSVTVSAILFILIPFYLWRVQNVRKILQVSLTSLAFVVWIYSLNGGPFAYFGLYSPWIASIVLILCTLLSPVLITPKKIRKV